MDKDLSCYDILRGHLIAVERDIAEIEIKISVVREVLNNCLSEVNRCYRFKEKVLKGLKDYES